MLDYCGVTSSDCFDDKMVENYSSASALISDVHFLVIIIRQISFANRICWCPIDCLRETEGGGGGGVAALITVSG